MSPSVRDRENLQPARVRLATLLSGLFAAREPSRLFSLDVLRGLAISLVLLRHFPPSDIDPGGSLESVVHAIADIGGIGVDLFFVLSGFLISGLIFKEYDRSGVFDAGRFWIRRGYKIWPCYFAAYGGMTLARLAWETIRGDYARVAQLTSGAACNSVFLQNYLHCARWSHSWSLAVEEHFYSVFAIVAGAVCWLSGRRKLDGARTFRFLVPTFVGVALFALYLRWQQCFPAYIDNGEAAHSQSHLRMDSLLFGVFLSYMLRYRVASIPNTLARWPAVMLALVLAFTWPTLWRTGHNPWYESIGLTLMYLSFGVAVLAAAVNPQFGFDAPRPLNRLFRFLAWLGVYSYTVYLAHAVLFGFPGVETLRQGMLAFIIPLAGEAVALWADRIIYLLVAIAGGVALSHAVERPFLRMRERRYAA
jgi:peptidoglycan/LPS O-acetylase OafA/YrhL